MSAIKKPAPMTRLKGVRNAPPIRRQPTSNARTCPNPSCNDPHLEDVDDKRVCTSCGSVVSDSNIVSEVQFGDSASGAAVVQGSYVSADQSHTRSLGSAFKRAGGMESREISDANGRRYINQLASALRIAPTTGEMAFQVYKLASAHNFIQGRLTKNVAAVCLYVACRKQKRNNIMLIDFADVLNTNVFKIGKTFKALMHECPIEGVEPVIAEDLVYRFATKLEFGRKTEQVAQDAAKLVQRMDRDWMTTGRRPSGICGACLILAARMNNFRRTVREVVYIVKVTEPTISKRLEEFKVTESSNLTVEQFRIINLESRHDPPAFYEQKKGKKSKKRKRGVTVEESQEEEDDESNSRDASAVPTTERRASSTQLQPEVRRDKDGYAIPEIPIDPTLLAASATALSELNPTAAASTEPSDQPHPPRRRGRPRKDGSVRPEPPQPTRADIAAEDELETEISRLLSDPSTQEHAEALENAQASAATIATLQRPDSDIPLDEHISDSEFADDPEVRDCVLSTQEREIKERIWVHENKDYLREQQRKLLRKQMEERNGGARVVRRRKRKGRIGEGGDGSVASSPAEATKAMLERRGFSKKINYSVIEKLFDSSSRRGSRAPSEVSSEAGASQAGSAKESKVPAEAHLNPALVDDNDGNLSGEDDEDDDDDEEVEEDIEHAIDDAVEESIEGAFDD
ncbi:MAG: transcription factor TFIIIB subunit brf1 [Sclerophora amabilis]|nr:MAG: transcription factor TFIIIB subunit brf1 [Sclerophora amabilis]